MLKLAPKPTVDEEVKANVVKVLRECLDMAERGEIDTVVVIMGLVNGEWVNRMSETLKYSEAIGRLEITKQEWVNKYLEKFGNE